MKKAIEYRNGYKDPERMAAIHEIGCSACIRNKLTQQYPTEAHHLIGYGMGKKPSDLLTISLCDLHHFGRFLRKGENRTGNSIHETPLKRWEKTFGTQQILLKLTNKLLASL